MRYKLTDLNSWPLRKNQEPIFDSTNDAFLYAQLICDLQEKQDLLRAYRKAIYRALKYLREKDNPNLDRMMNLAVRAQFLRECLEECQRINNEKFNTNGWNPTK